MDDPPPDSDAADPGEDGHHDPRRRAALALAALGIVYGDIGTSPLYAMRESFEGVGHQLEVTEANVLGVLSLILWSLVLVISVKYLWVVMRADNDGEGGILALTSLIPVSDHPRRRRQVVVLFGLLGTALLYGDGMITPAISVLSAVEGTEVVAPGLADLAVPLAVVILLALFAVQRFGTGGVGRVFGPAMLVWFGVLGLLGLTQLVQEPGVLAAVNPVHGARFFAENGMTGFFALGSVFLVVTGGEALYADLGHFGRGPIALGWSTVVLPGLLLNYFGQGALLLGSPGAIDNPFYRLAPAWAGVPLAVLATAATVIASQALISGAFSLTMQAAQFGYLPRVRVIHTSDEERGQVYVPAVNWVLMVACIGLVVTFRTSSALAAAYGVAVALTMVVTTVLFYVVAVERFEWSRPAALGVCGGFMVLDLAYFGANVPKIPDGGWFPLVIAAVVLAVFTTWATGRRLVRQRSGRGVVPLEPFLDNITEQVGDQRVEGTAVYLYGGSDVAPPPLVYNFQSNHVLHEQVLLVNVVTRRAPHVHPLERVSVQELEHGIRQVQVHYGYNDRPRVALDLERELDVGPEGTTYFLGREHVLPSDRPGMADWRERLFVLLRRNSTDAAGYFNLPPDRVIEISRQVEL